MREVRALRSYAEVALGRQRSPQHDSGSHMVPYLRAANVKDGILELDDVKSMNFDPKEQVIFGLRHGDVLVTEGSGSLSAVGASAVWRGEIPGVICFQNTLLRLRPRSTTDPRFLGWWCRHAFADGLFAAIATGANIHHVSAERVRSLPMRYLQLPEQRSISEYLDTETVRFDALIAKKRQMIMHLEERWEAFLAQEFASVRGEVASLGRVCSEISQGESPQAGGRARGQGEIGLLKLSAVRSGEYRPEENKVLESNYIATRGIVPMVGDLLITRANTPSLVGDVCAVVEADPSVILCDLIYRLRLHRNLVNPEYVAFSLLTGMSRAHLSSSARGTSQSMVKLRAEDLKSCPLVIPGLAEQELLVMRLNSMKASKLSATHVLERQISLLAEHRQALITAAVTGELEIPKAA